MSKATGCSATRTALLLQSLTFQLAPLYRNQICITVTPLLALGKDQVSRQQQQPSSEGTLSDTLMFQVLCCACAHRLSAAWSWASRLRCGAPRHQRRRSAALPKSCWPTLKTPACACCEYWVGQSCCSALLLWPCYMVDPTHLLLSAVHLLHCRLCNGQPWQASNCSVCCLAGILPLRACARKSCGKLGPAAVAVVAMHCTGATVRHPLMRFTAAAAGSCCCWPTRVASCAASP